MMRVGVEEIASHLEDAIAIKHVLSSLRVSLRAIGLPGDMHTGIHQVLDRRMTVNEFRAVFAAALGDAYAGGYQADTAPTFLCDLVNPELDSASRVLDLGCGPGHLLKRLSIKHPDRSFVGFDLHRYPEWSQDSMPNVRFATGSLTDTLRKWQPDLVIATYSLHHIPYRQQADYIDLAVGRKARVIVVEDSYATGLQPEVGAELWKAFSFHAPRTRQHIMAILDWVATRLLAGRMRAPIPFSFRRMEDWNELFQQRGFDLVRCRFIGFPDRRDVDTPQSMLVLDRDKKGHRACGDLARARGD